jgi:AraC-like DNA-binding protein
MQVWHNKSDDNPCLDFQSHIHAEYEILYVFSGDIEFYHEGYKYPLLPESLLLTPANIFHGWKALSLRLYHRVAILFLPELLDSAEQALFLKLFTGGPRFFSVIPRTLNFFIQAILACKDMEAPLRQCALKSRLISLLSEISLLQTQQTAEPVLVDPRIMEVLKFLEEHLREELFLEDLARRFSISKNHLNNLFSEVTGTTVSHYIRIKRVTLARQEMAQGFSAEDAAYRAGFNDYSNFYRAYKSFYGSMPSAHI